jgi:hypothetical protein
MPIDGRWLTGLHGPGSSRARPGHHPGPIRTRRREHAVITGKFARGFGTSATSLAIKSSGSKITCVVPSRYGVFSARRTRPPSVSDSCPVATGGPGNVARQVFELVPLVGFRRNARVQRDKIAGSDFAQPKAGPKGAGQDARSNPELSATSRRGSSGSAGSVCSVNILALARARRDPVRDRRAEQTIDRRLLSPIEREIRVLDVACNEPRALERAADPLGNPLH